MYIRTVKYRNKKPKLYFFLHMTFIIIRACFSSFFLFNFQYEVFYFPGRITHCFEKVTLCSHIIPYVINYYVSCSELCHYDINSCDILTLM